MSNTTGTVKWFNETKGFGFIQTDEGKDVLHIFLRFKHKALKFFLEGQRVQFTVTQGKRPTSFEYHTDECLN